MRHQLCMFNVGLLEDLLQTLFLFDTPVYFFSFFILVSDRTLSFTLLFFILGSVSFHLICLFLSKFVSDPFPDLFLFVLPFLPYFDYFVSFH